MLHVDGHRLYSDTNALLQYIHIVTVLLQQYLLAQDTLRPFFVPSVAANDENKQKTVRQCETVMCKVKNDGHSKPGVNSCHGAEDNQSPTSCSHYNNDCTKSDHLKPVTATSSSDNIWSIDLTHLDKQERATVKGDIKVLKDFKFYLSLFRYHLSFLCKPSEMEKMECELFDLLLLAGLLDAVRYV